MMLSHSAWRLATPPFARPCGRQCAGGRHGVMSRLRCPMRLVSIRSRRAAACTRIRRAASTSRAVAVAGLAGRSSGGGSGSSSSDSSMDSDSDRDSDTSNKSHSSGTAAKPTLVKGQRHEGGRWIGHEPNPQLQLQAWLQQEQGLPEKEADEHARRLVAVFGGNEAAALASLPATFSWCRSQGLSGLQTAQLLGRIADTKHASVVNFATTTQLDWQRLDGYVSAHFQRQRQAGERLSKHASLGSKLVGSAKAAQALTVPPGRVAAWLAEMEQWLPAADLGATLAGHPEVVTGGLETALGAMDWAASKWAASQPANKVPDSDGTKAFLGSFFRIAPSLLKSNAATLQRHLDNLQEALGLTAEQGWQLAAKYPKLLQSKTATVSLAAQRLQQLFPKGVDLLPVVLRAPVLLTSPGRLQRNADALQRLGLSRNQVVSYISDFPQVFATVNLSGSETAAKLLFMTKVLGVASEEQCIAQYGSYLKTSLESMCALYILMQERAPLVFWTKGRLSLTWMVINDVRAKRSGISKAEMQRHTHAWVRSEGGLRLLAGLRSGSTEGWPEPHTVEQPER